MKFFQKSIKTAGRSTSIKAVRSLVKATPPTSLDKKSKNKPNSTRLMSSKCSLSSHTCNIKFCSDMSIFSPSSESYNQKQKPRRRSRKLAPKSPKTMSECSSLSLSKWIKLKLRKIFIFPFKNSSSMQSNLNSQSPREVCRYSSLQKIKLQHNSNPPASSLCSRYELATNLILHEQEVKN